MLEDLRRPLAARGFNILLPLSRDDFDRACAPVAPGLTLRALFADATSAIIVGSGGQDLFARFRAAPEATDGRPDPLDRFTRAAVTAAVHQALGPEGLGGDDPRGGRAGAGVGRRIFFPFVPKDDPDSATGPRVPQLPFQRLGRAAGLGAPGPLGLQIHPFYGPWWAYRALIALDGEAPRAVSPVRDDCDDGAVGDGCAGCDAPCVGACPAGAVRLTGFSIADCHARRLVAPACQLSCVARIRCVRGPAQRYTDEQLAFHMAASMPVPRP